MVKFGCAVLTIQTAHRRIKIHRLVLDLIQYVDIARTLIDAAEHRLDDGEDSAIFIVRHHVDERVQKHIGGIADRIARA